MTRTLCFDVRDLRRSYGGEWNLHLPALEVRTGELFAVIGPTGAGKSTLLKLLHFLEAPDSGRIAFEGRDVSFPAPLDVRRAIGMVFQRPLMLAGTVRDNLGFGLRLRGRRDDARVGELLRRLAIESFGDREARTLSGGEMQRLALARALAYAPRVLLLDEPAANLDPAHAAVIEGIIREIHRQQGTTVVLATHHLAQARRLAQRVGLLAGGRLVEIGETEDLFTQPRQPLTAAYLRGELLNLERADS